MTERVAVVGSREYPYMQEVARFVESLPPGTVVVSGGARGVDFVAEVAARRAGLEVSIHKADWDGLGKRAGFVRNEAIVADCTRLVAFWDEQSKGTAHTIRLARRAGKPTTVVTPTDHRDEEEDDDDE